MTKDRIDLLNDLGFVWNTQEMTWNQHLNSLKSFREQYGHSNVSVNDTKYSKLHLWISKQRRSYAFMKQGKNSNITPARVSVLDSIGFCWDPYDAQWLLRLQELTDFTEKHGRYAVPADCSSRQLQKWFFNQRRAYTDSKEDKPGSMPEERIRALDNIRYNWNPTPASSTWLPTDYEPTPVDVCRSSRGKGF
jgi:hypothetical protein